MNLPSVVRDHAVPMALVLSVALLSAQLSIRLRADTLHELFQSELGTLFGRPLRPESQNRILPAGMLVLLRDIVPATISDKSVWFASRLFQAVLTYAVLYAVAFRLTGGRLRALAAVGLVGYFYIWTPLSHPWEYTSDFLDILFCIGVRQPCPRRATLPAGLHGNPRGDEP